MGKMASQAVARLCENERIVDEQIAFRADVQRRGAQRSLTVVAFTQSIDRNDTVCVTEFVGEAGIVVFAPTSIDAEPLLQSIAEQTMPATAVALVCGGVASEKDQSRADKCAGQGVLTLSCPSSLRSEAWNAGYSHSSSRRIRRRASIVQV